MWCLCPQLPALPHQHHPPLHPTPLLDGSCLYWPHFQVKCHRCLSHASCFPSYRISGSLTLHADCCNPFLLCHRCLLLLQLSSSSTCSETSCCCPHCSLD